MVISALFNKALWTLQCSHYNLSKNDILVGNQFSVRNLGVCGLEADCNLKLFGTYSVILSLGADFATQRVLGPSHMNLLKDWKIIDRLIWIFEKPVLSELKNYLFCHLTTFYCSGLNVNDKSARRVKERSKQQG